MEQMKLFYESFVLSIEVVIGGSLSDKGRTELCSVLKKNLDIFAWQPSDMTGAPERARAIQAEVQKLVDARIMREVYYHDWLSNPVMVESLCGYLFKCFLDAYKGYHQIQLAEADEGKTTFHTGQGVYCYTKMPFGLKNAGTTYQRLMDKAFKSQVGRNIEVYVDDLVVKSYTEVEMMRDIEETFRTLRKVNMKLNPKNAHLGDVSQAAQAAVTQKEPWTLFTDGSSCVDGSGAGLILKNPEGEFTYTLRFQFTASNNEAEYEALVAANQVLGTYVAKEDNMIKYLEIVKGLVSGFTTFSISQVPRSKNKKADALSKITSTSFAHLSKQVLVEVLENKSIKEKEVAAVIEKDGPTWMTQLVDYLKEGVLPGDKKEARKLRPKARPLQAEYVMREIHEGSCSMHAGPRSVVAKVVRLGPLSGRDGEGQIPDSRHGLLYKVDRSKGSGNNYRRTSKEIRMGQYCMPLRYPGRNNLDNGKQFADNPFKDWCDKLNITQRFASVKHPQSNGLAHRTMIKSSHDDTPFSLTYGTEAVIPTEIEMPTYRTAAADVVNNDEELRLNLDLLEERRERAAVCEARPNQR
nr:hypothetical protein [Tanacetum cinerariifolium]